MSIERRPAGLAVSLLVFSLAACGETEEPVARSSPSAPGEATIPAEHAPTVLPIENGMPYLVVLGIAQDGGVPQAGSDDHPAWSDPSLWRLVVSLGLVDPRDGGSRYLFEATPDFRQQLHALTRHQRAGVGAPALDGVFLTHGHVGHYVGLLFLGHEVIGASSVPVYAMPRMAHYLSSNGPWDQLVRYENIALRPLEDGSPAKLAPDLSVTPFLVPHRQEYTEVVGFRIDGPSHSVLFVPDINSFEAFDEWGTRIEDLIAGVDVAYLDGSFWAQGEIQGRDMSQFPHPMIAECIERFSVLPTSERAKIRFIHLNHTNPVQDRSGAERAQVLEAGFGIAEEGERVGL